MAGIERKGQQLGSIRVDEDAEPALKRAGKAVTRRTAAPKKAAKKATAKKAAKKATAKKAAAKPTTPVAAAESVADGGET